MADSGSISPPWYRAIARPQWMALALAGLGWAFESYDSYSLSLTVPVISSQFGLSKATVGSLLSATAAGQMIGGICFGYVADRLGRVRTAFLCICIYSFFSALFAAAHSVEQLFILRTCGAFGMGGMWTSGAALIAETWPAKLRGRGGALMQAGLPIGAMIAIAVSALIGNTVGLTGGGWRIIYVIGALPAVVLFFVARATPESPVWLARQHGAGPVDAVAGEKDADLWRYGLIAFALVFCLQYVFWGVTSWTPTYLVTARGMNLVGSLNYVLTQQVGALSGFIVFAAFVDRVGRRPMFALYLAIGAVAVGSFVFGPAGLLFPSLFFAGAAVNGIFAGLGPFIAELMATARRRGFVMGLIYNGGRLGGISAPTIIGLLASGKGSLAAGLGTTVIALVAGLLVIMMAPETKGREIR